MEILIAIRRTFVASLFALLAIAATNGRAWADPPASAKPALEYQIKASLIFNFVQFVEWPEADESDTSEFKICVPGSDPFGRALRTLESQLVRGRRIRIIHPELDDTQTIAECEVVFFGKESSFEITGMLASLQNAHVLSIGETPEFINHGGIISMIVENDRVVFEINRAEAARSNLVISSKLLRLARKVVEE